MHVVGRHRAIGPTETSVRLAHALALAAVGEEAQSRAAIAAARDQVLSRAARCPDVEARHAYLTTVPVIVETLALADRLA
jgi:hypothetical protein